VISFSVSGLGKGDWVDMEIFFRGNGDIIGATKIDENLLGEMRKKEALDAAVEEARGSEDDAMVGLAERAGESSDEVSEGAVETDWGSIAPESGVDE
jgi:hypothetical protein